jgi:transcription-repair coupling factor (superfamily II helicase)
MSGATVHGAPEGHDALLLAKRRAETSGAMVHVCRDDSRMARMAEALAFFTPHADVLRFPAWDCLPYDRVSPNPEIVSERVATLTRLMEPSAAPRILLTTVNALVQLVPPRAAFAGATMSLRRAGRSDPERLAQFLEANGYHRTATVMEHGEYAVRGGILDLFPAGESDPVRIDFFGDEVEDIRRFDTGTQRSGERWTGWAAPGGRGLPGPDSISRFRTAYRELFGAAAAEDRSTSRSAPGRKHPGMEHWAGLFHARWRRCSTTSPAHSSPRPPGRGRLRSRLEMIADHYSARARRPREGRCPTAPAPPARSTWTAGWDAMLPRRRRRPVPLLPLRPARHAEGAVEAAAAPAASSPRRARRARTSSTSSATTRGMAKRGHRAVLAAWTAARASAWEPSARAPVPAAAVEDWPRRRRPAAGRGRPSP